MSQVGNYHTLSTLGPYWMYPYLSKTIINVFQQISQDVE